jgi:hypothetical protein
MEDSYKGWSRIEKVPVAYTAGGSKTKIELLISNF